MEIAGVPDARRARHGAARRGRACRSAAITIRRSSRAASSSASRSPARSPTIRRCCSPTSPPATSTARPAAQVIDLLLDVNRLRGTTLVLVTHDPELAGVADVAIALRDGRVVSSRTDRTDGNRATVTPADALVTDPAAR